MGRGPRMAGVDEDFFRALERRRTRALVERDMATLEELHAPDYELVTPAGKLFTRQQYLAAIAGEPFYADWTIDGDIAVRLSAEMAIVRYTARLRFPSGREVVCRHSDSYERRGDGRWQAVWSQATELRTAA
ncbi:nuclear transport factor 2 family protein [Roseateles violae]|uniref:Nuclear transport factor 2 family protein n=1 Tax=Roseateles violae TaxID=3058042 RepID=A0ABT8DSR2_9BURK|nr:nuclear transport factor 2 family protein [Pelomonas sp. PFR6]MDN3921357.1 nuclear transport factor 2 family protein [Pelomonas sp. PFR6]